jgi:hypothetical protein
VLLTVTNLRGVPYKVVFRADPDALPDMSMAGDFMHYGIGSAVGLPSDVVPLPRDRFDDPGWTSLAEAALATAAFPVGLAPRELWRKASDYASRTWPATVPVVSNGTITGCGLFTPLPPAWPEAIAHDPRFQYDFLCIDGGVVDNEPLELARRVLDGEGPPFFHPKTKGNEADNALVAIAPFPSVGTYPVQEPPVGNPYLMSVLGMTLQAAITQMRFDPSQALLAASRDIYNRYLITPERAPVPRAKVQSRIASGSLGGFGGFLSRAFRDHDYQLGRLNAQHFLQHIFALPAEPNNQNPLFDVGWTEAARRLYQIVEAPDQRDLPPRSEARAGDHVFLPIIPVMGTAAQPVPLLDWPTYTQDQLDTLTSQVDARLTAVVSRLISRNATPLALRLALQAAFRLVRGQVTSKIVTSIASDLRDSGLLV